MANLDDESRLAALDDVITEIAPDPQLDALISGVAAVANTPIALVSIIMEHTQFFRAHIGLTGELAVSRATSRCDSFCQFVVRDELPFIVTDAFTDQRVPKALVDAYGIRAYVGVPLRYRGQVIGSVCAADVQAREFTAQQVEAMGGLAGYISNRLNELQLLRNQSNGDATVAIRRDALAQVERSLAELGPLLRLAEGIIDGRLTAAEFTRNAKALGELVGHYDRALKRVQQLKG